MPKKLNEEIINAAIEGFEARKTHLTQQISELRGMLEGGPTQSAAPAAPAPRNRRRLSVAARRRIAEAQQLRWAKIRGKSERAAPAARTAIKPKRRISPEGMKRIIAATKKRFRLQRAATKAKSVKVAKKKAPVRKAA
jgi:hypothetical protein